jgi:putative PIN family toxin of toxin-antitoxin system
VKRVVFDTNIYISAFITPGGRGETAYLKAVEGSIQLYSSVPILTELARKLQDKFKWETDRVNAAIRHVAAVATVLKPSGRISVVADEPDNRILECAAAGNADMVVTGDRHLLDLKTHEGIEIVTLAVFLERA